MERFMGISSSNKERQGKKRNIILTTTIERCRFLGGHIKALKSLSTGSALRWRLRHFAGHRVAPGGCFPVYVGPRRERFLIKIECVNHPLFRVLLDGAGDPENKVAGGPLELPCDVKEFWHVIWEMEEQDEGLASPRSTFSRTCTTLGL